MKTTFLAFLLALAYAQPAQGAVDWFDPAYLEANTYDYGTGFITVPSATIMPKGWLSASIHRYRVKLDYGFWNVLELGLTSDVEGSTDIRNLPNKTLLFGRAQILRQKINKINFSIGANGIGWEDVGLETFGFKPDPAFNRTDVYYAVAGRTVPWLPSMVVTAGAAVSPAYTQDTGGGRKEKVDSKTWLMANVSMVVIDGLLLMAERDRGGYNFGARLLLSTKIKLDLTLFDAGSIRSSNPFADVLDRNIRFGISYTEKWPG